jgi:hypothetical protein
VIRSGYVPQPNICRINDDWRIKTRLERIRSRGVSVRRDEEKKSGRGEEEEDRGKGKEEQSNTHSSQSDASLPCCLIVSFLSA